MPSAPERDASGPVGYLGPAGSWTHQACIDLFGAQPLVPLARDALLQAFEDGRIARICVPVSTSVVGATPYLSDVLALRGALVVAEYFKMLGYSLLARPGTRRDAVTTVVAHPVALQEVRPWLDREMPHVRRQAAASGGAAAQQAAASIGVAAMGAPIAAALYGLAPIASGIEEGPHNVTRWWVLGRALPAPTGRDKSTLLLSAHDRDVQRTRHALAASGVAVIAACACPDATVPDRHIIDVAGHAQREPLHGFLAAHRELTLLGSYPRPVERDP